MYIAEYVRWHTTYVQYSVHVLCLLERYSMKHSRYLEVVQIIVGNVGASQSRLLDVVTLDPVAQIILGHQVGPLEVAVRDGTHGTARAQPQLDGGGLKDQAGWCLNRLLHHVSVDRAQKFLGDVVCRLAGSIRLTVRASVVLHELGVRGVRVLLVAVQRQGQRHRRARILAPVAAKTRQVAQQAVLIVLGGVAARGVALVLLLGLVLLVARARLGVLVISGVGHGDSDLEGTLLLAIRTTGAAGGAGVIVVHAAAAASLVHLSEQLHALGMGSLGLGTAVQKVRLIAVQALSLGGVESGISGLHVLQLACHTAVQHAHDRGVTLSVSADRQGSTEHHALTHAHPLRALHTVVDGRQLRE
eukprot:Colp12_sorted_trinity150504_noHs@27688